MADLFRKTSLEKLSSPEQLDKMIVITPPTLWAALAGAALIIAAALIWAVLGRVPVNVETQGIYVNNGGIYSVYSESSGIVEEVAVKKGDNIEKGDVVAYLNTDEIQKKLDEYDEKIKKVEAITMDSESDAITADNKSLVEIKDQMLTVDQTLQQDQAMLELRTQDVAEQRQKTAEAENAMREAELAYYNSLNVGDSTDLQMAYNDAQSELANASGYLESAYSNLDEAQVALTQAKGQYQNTKDDYNKLIAKEKSLSEVVTEMENSVRDKWKELGGTGDIDFDKIDDYPAMLESIESKTEMKEVIEKYKAARDNYDSFVSENAEAKAQLKSYMDQYELEKEAAEDTLDNYRESVSKYQSQKESASTNYNNARTNYLNRLSDLSEAQNSQTQLYNKYNIALSDYNTADSTLTSLLEEMEQLEVQVESDRRTMEKEIETIYSQFEATKASVIDQLTMEREQYQNQMKNCTIISSVSGRISNVSVVPGSAVNQGSELLKVQQGSGEDDVVVCYVSLSSGKKVKEGMEVLIYPSTVNKQEYGHMEATVEFVDTYVSSTESLRTQLGNDNLVESFLKEGPVVAVTCGLRTDDSTESGYYWSSAKGKNLTIAEGTLVDASVIIEEKAPITMLIPYIKEKLTIQAVEEE